MSVLNPVETCMALLGTDVPLPRLRLACPGDTLERHLAESKAVVVSNDRVRWKPGKLHRATQGLSREQIESYLRAQAGVSAGEAANILRLCVYLNRQTHVFPAAFQLRRTGWSAAYFHPPDTRFLAEREPTLRAIVLEDLAPFLWARGIGTPLCNSWQARPHFWRRSRARLRWRGATESLTCPRTSGPGATPGSNSTCKAISRPPAPNGTAAWPGGKAERPACQAWSQCALV